MGSQSVGDDFAFGTWQGIEKENSLLLVQIIKPSQKEMANLSAHILSLQ